MIPGADNAASDLIGVVCFIGVAGGLALCVVYAIGIVLGLLRRLH